MSRTIKVFSTETNERKEIVTNATTWGQLKEEIRRAGLNADNMKGMVRDSRVTLENDQAALPDGDTTIFITPQKVRSGVISPSKEIKSLKGKVTRKKIAVTVKSAAPKKSTTKKVATRKATTKRSK